MRFRARRNRQEPVFSLRGIENALNRYLQKQDKGPSTPLDRLASAADAAETAARLRLAAPEVAQEVEQRTLAQEMVLVKLAALEIADEEVDGLIADVRGKQAGAKPAVIPRPAGPACPGQNAGPGR